MTLDGILAEMTLLKMAVRGCEGPLCPQLSEGAEGLRDATSELWRYVSNPEGKRDSIDTIFRDIEDHAASMDLFLPRAQLPDADALMREWAGTHERVGRFHRVLRQQSGDGATASSR